MLWVFMNSSTKPSSFCLKYLYFLCLLIDLKSVIQSNSFVRWRLRALITALVGTSGLYHVRLHFHTLEQFSRPLRSFLIYLVSLTYILFGVFVGFVLVSYIYFGIAKSSAYITGNTSMSFR